MTIPLRLVLRKVESSPLENGQCRFVSWLAGKGEIYTGEAISPDDDEEHQLHAVVQATMNAINKAVRKPIDMRLLYTKQIFLPEVTKVIFLVIIQTGSTNYTRLLPGICLFTNLTPEIAARATLNALNRTIARFA